jgi:putative ABC transport system permease protein
MKRTLLWESIRVGLDALRVHPTRTFLSTTGIVIGVLALVATLSVIDGIDAFSRSLIERESSVQDIIVAPRRSVEHESFNQRIHSAPVMTLDDWRATHAMSPMVTAAVLSYTGDAMLGANGRWRHATLILGTANFAEFSGLNIAEGRFFSDAEMWRRAAVVVLGHRLAEELASPRDGFWLVGQMVRVGGRRLEVIGVLESRPGETDLVAFAPIGSRPDASEFSSGLATPVLRMKAASIEAVPHARDAAVDWIAQRFGRDRSALEVTVGLERLERAAQAILLSKLIFGLLVTLMLAIGGIGIMNVLLASVAERMREIGIRKAIGARGRDIMLHFLAESVSIAGMGAVMGAIGGVGVAFLSMMVFRGLAHADVQPVFRAETVGLTIASAIAVGVGFGIYPALKAARLTPIDAIQRD